MAITGFLTSAFKDPSMFPKNEPELHSASLFLVCSYSKIFTMSSVIGWWVDRVICGGVEITLCFPAACPLRTNSFLDRNKKRLNEELGAEKSLFSKSKSTFKSVMKVIHESTTLSWCVLDTDFIFKIWRMLGYASISRWIEMFSSVWSYCCNLHDYVSFQV